MTQIPGKNNLEFLEFDNQFVDQLPADKDTTNSPRQVMNACYTKVMPKKASSPKLVAFSKDMAEQLGFESIFCKSQAFADLFSGNSLSEQMIPFAMCYGGHQFGNWAGQLGDGRAINLGEIMDASANRWMLQLKGAGPTPYSRFSDGLAVLRSSIREFICSEAMFHLGIPTTRALSLVLTGDKVERDMFYDGHPRMEPGAVVCRVSPSFTRFGNFEIFTSRNNHTILKQLVDYTIKTDFNIQDDPCSDVYLHWFKEICKITAQLMVSWMCVGFVHGVMNTDNMSIAGLTIDYGPYGWMEDYNPHWTPNTTDAGTRRYTFGNQPAVAHWNLYQLANALFPLIKKKTPLTDVLENYQTVYQNLWQKMMASKLGFKQFDPDTDSEIFQELLSLLHMVETDMTIFFRRLADFKPILLRQFQTGDLNSLPFGDAYYRPDQITSKYTKRFFQWLNMYAARLESEHLEFKTKRKNMNRINPKYIFRNYLAQMAIDKAEKDDFSMIEELMGVLKFPYEEQHAYSHYFIKRPEWARHRPGASMLSCSS